MRVIAIHIYRILVILVCLLVVPCLGICENSQNEEITWEDIEGDEVFSVKKDESRQAEAISQENNNAVSMPERETKAQSGYRENEAAQVTVEVKKVPLTGPAQGGRAIETKAQTKASKKKSPSAKKVPTKEESVWSRAETITSGDPAANRDIFSINPDRE